MLILVVNVAISFPTSVFSSYIVAKERFIASRILLIAKQLLGPFIAIPLMLKGFASIGVVIGMLVASALVDAFCVAYSVAKLKICFDFRHPEIKLVRSIFVFSFFIFINLVVDQINWYVDKMLLGIYQGTRDTAIYGLAATINTQYLAFSTAISSVYVPRVNYLISRGNYYHEINHLFLRIGRIQWMVIIYILSMFIYFGMAFITQWYGGVEYQTAYIIAIILMASETIPLTQNLGIEIQRAMNKHQFRSVLYLGIAVINLGISIPLCQMYSGIGCAIGTAIGQVVGNTIIMNWYYQKHCNIDIKAYWKMVCSLLPKLLPVLGIGVLLHFLPIAIKAMLIGMFALYTILFALNLFYLVMTKDERMRINTALHRKHA
jgi:O-antigen/teichoic acid export membrane protein